MTLWEQMYEAARAVQDLRGILPLIEAGGAAELLTKKEDCHKKATAERLL